jgi:imidazolonepropionase-like amidohydrolase
MTRGRAGWLLGLSLLTSPIVGTTAAVPTSHTTAVEEKPIAIVHGTVIDGRGGPPIADGTVIVRGGLIETVGPAGGITLPPDSLVLDARGKSVMPGLADMHVHLQGGYDGTNIDMLGYQRYLNALLYSGVTTVLDTGNYQPWILQIRSEIAAGRLVGPRVYCVGAMIDGLEPAWPDLAYPLATPAQIPGLVRRDKEAGVDLIKAYANLSDRMLGKLTDEASRAGLRVIIDAWERNGSPDVSRAGISGYAHLPTRPMPAEEIRLIKDKGIFVITTLAVNESFARTRFADPGYLKTPLIADPMPPWFIDDVRAFITRPLDDKTRDALPGYQNDLAESRRNARKFLDAGILMATGTDALYPGLFQGEGLHRELELLVEAGWTPLQAIRAATYDAARIMKAEAVWGSLQKGLRADILVVAGRPADSIGETRRIETVIQGGRILDRASLKYDAARDRGFRPIPGLFSE